MKINEIKHNHSLTDLLKVLLFSILMLLPFIDVGVRCGYVMLNKNAYQSYSGININDKQVNNISSIDYTTMYYFDSKIVNDNTNITGSQLLFQYEIVINDNFINTTNWDIGSSDRCYVNNNNNQPIFYSGTTSFGQVSLNQRVAFNFYLITYNPINDNIDNYMKTIFKTIGTPVEQSLDNVFEYSVSQLEESNLFNWTTQTAIYSGVSQMTTQLGITGNIIPIILCYWFFITIIYIILDIVIKLFTILTHFIGSKTSS